MTKKIINFMTTLLLILAAMCALISFVGCGTPERRTHTTGLVKAKDMNAIALANKYNQPVTVEAYKEKGKVINYYVTYSRDIRHTDTDGNEDYIKVYYADKYDSNNKMVDFNTGYSYVQAISVFGEAKP